MEDHATVLNELLTSRRSCRGFRSDEVPPDLLKRLLSMAQNAASWCNTQPWHLHVTRGEGTARIRAALEEDQPSAPDFKFPLAYEGVYLERRRECGFQLYEAMGVARGDRVASAAQASRNFELFGAPHLAVITTESALGDYGAIDCGLYVQAFLLSAESLGLGAIAQAAIADKSATVRRVLNLPDQRKIVCGISFGYADLDHPSAQFRTTRADVDSVFTYVD